MIRNNPGTQGVVQVPDTPIPPSVADEQALSGTTPDPEADDEVLENAHQMGIGLNADEENPQPLNIAHDVEQAEKNRE